MSARTAASESLHEQAAAAQCDGPRSGRSTVQAFRSFDADPEIAAIVLTGEAPGSRRKRPEIHRPLSLEEMCRFEAETGDMARLIGFVRKPVVAAVEGFALGGGFILAVSCDLVVSSDSARWHLPEVPIGWLTPWGLAGAGFAGRRGGGAKAVLRQRGVRRPRSVAPRPRRSSRRGGPGARNRAGAGGATGRPAGGSSRRHQAFLRARDIRAFPKCWMSRRTRSSPAIAVIRSRARRSSGSAPDDQHETKGRSMLKRRQQGQVAILTIDRSNRRNALGTELMQARSATPSLNSTATTDVAAIVLSATAPGFCAGSDLKELAMMNIAEMCRARGRDGADRARHRFHGKARHRRRSADLRSAAASALRSAAT